MTRRTGGATIATTDNEKMARICRALADELSDALDSLEHVESCVRDGEISWSDFEEATEAAQAVALVERALHLLMPPTSLADAGEREHRAREIDALEGAVLLLTANPRAAARRLDEWEAEDALWSESRARSGA